MCRLLHLSEVFRLSSILASWLLLYCVICNPSDSRGTAPTTKNTCKSGGSNAPDVVRPDTPAASQPVPLPQGSAHPSTTATKPGPAPRTDKSGFTLLHPTPQSLMRKFNTDRPDQTESPFTVDAGHFQVEFSFVEYTHNRNLGGRAGDFSVLPANLKVGLLNNLDLQLVLNPYQNVLTHGQPSSQRESGFGNAELRAKLNLWGNDGGKTAFGVMPFIRFPTGSGGLSNHHVEGGLILPLAVQELPGGFDLGTMAEFDLDRNDRNDAYGMDFVHSVTMGHELFTKKLNGYVEYYGMASVRTDRTYLASFDTGATHALSKNVQLDAGIEVGLSHRADHFTVFAGLSFRR
jgi:Putative MetA-pathway of phenol degradation